MCLRMCACGEGHAAAAPVEDGWAQGPSLSILGHVGLLLGVIFFTLCMLAGRSSDLLLDLNLC